MSYNFPSVTAKCLKNQLSAIELSNMMSVLRSQLVSAALHWQIISDCRFKSFSQRPKELPLSSN